MGEVPIIKMADGRELVFYTTDYVHVRLQDAGRTLKMLPGAGCFPAKFRSCMPAVVHSVEDAYGWTEPAEVRFRPTMRQMNELEQVLEWLPILAKMRGRQNLARVIAYRMLVHPDTYKPVNSWDKIARVLKINKRTAKNWYEEGLRILAGTLTEMAEIESFR